MSDDAFQAAATRVKGLKKSPSNDELLSLYALYKQGSSGDCTGKAPSRLKLKEHAKHKAWSKLAGMGRDDAQSKYVALVDDLVGRLG